MPKIINVPITPARVQLIESQTGIISREWYMFLLSLYNNINETIIITDDLAITPPAVTLDEVTGSINNAISDLIPINYGLIDQLAELYKTVDGLEPINCGLIDQVIELYKTADGLIPISYGLTEQIAEISKRIDAIELQPKAELGTLSQIQQDNVPWLKFDTTPQSLPTATGSLYWDESDGIKSLDLIMEDGITQAIGRSTFSRIKASSAITKGQVVMFTGAVGASGAITGAPATGLVPSQSGYILGVAAQDIANNAWGYVTWFGAIRGLDTSGGAEAWVDGQIVYYNPAVTGGLTKTLPASPNVKVALGSVIKAASVNGILAIRPTFGLALGNGINDVQIGTPVNGNTLIYNESTGRWENATLTAGTNVTITNGPGSITINSTNPGGTVTYVSALTLGTSGTDLSSTVANPTTTPVITLNVPTASSSNRGALSSTDWTTFNNKQAALVSGTNIKTVGTVSLLGSGDVSDPSFNTVTSASTIDATSPNSGTTGGFRLRGNATSGHAYFQVTNSTGATQWAYADITSAGTFAWSAALSATTITASTQFSGPGTGLSGTAASLSVGGSSASCTGNAATATNVAGSGITGTRGIPVLAMPAGTILQVVNAVYGTSTSTTSTSYSSTGLSATITPTKSNSKILVIVSQNSVQVNNAGNGANMYIDRGGTNIHSFGTIVGYNSSGGVTISQNSANYLDSPATTSATTYTTYFASNTAGQTVYVQANGVNSTMTLLEIAV